MMLKKVTQMLPHNPKPLAERTIAFPLSPTAAERDQRRLPSDKEDVYCTDVLIGNWFENRFAGETDKRAVVPCVYGTSHCLENCTTLYRENFTTPVPRERTHCRKGALEFRRVKSIAFHNRIRDKNANIKLIDSEQFLENMTTMNDVMYRIKPVIAPTTTVIDNITTYKRQDTDYLKSYGNVSLKGECYINRKMQADSNYGSTKVCRARLGRHCN